MEDDTCSKHYPKSFCSETNMNADGFPVYKRRDDKRTALKNGVELDNRWVVPHNVDLVVKYDGHINVEHCNQGRSIKYLFKYINKGQDRATFRVEENLTSNGETNPPTIIEVDELSRYRSCRYVSGSESCWRGFGFDIQYRDVAVERLSFHLPGEQSVFFRDTDALDDVVNRENVEKTMFTEWMASNRTSERARELTYVEFPTKWTWKKNSKEWVERKAGRTIGRLYFVQPSAGERYYLRMLLNIVKGPTCYEDIRTVDGILYPSFKEACSALGLLDSDEEWHEVIVEASQWASGHQLRQLFVTLVLFCEVTDHYSLWDKNNEILMEDIVYRESLYHQNQVVSPSTEFIENYALYEIEQIMNKNGRPLTEFKSLPFPDMYISALSRNTMIMDELRYDRSECLEEHRTLHVGSNDEQKVVYDRVVEAASGDIGGFFFVYGSRGTGKTYLWKTIISRLRSERENCVGRSLFWNLITIASMRSNTALEI